MPRGKNFGLLDNGMIECIRLDTRSQGVHHLHHQLCQRIARVFPA